MPAIQVEKLSKVYRSTQKESGVLGAIKSLFRPHFVDKVAVDGISFKIEQGETVGFIGVNGAGKSTTIKMLTGILAPTNGSINVLGRVPHRQRVENAREIGVVFGQRSQLWWDLALIESLNTIAKIYEVPSARYKQLLEQLSETLELNELLRVPIRSMSLGQKMRAELVATLLHEPAIIYLDEPTIGLDLMAKERIREFIKTQNRERGTLVFLTTHDLGDIEEVCQRVLLIDSGKLIYDGPLSTIKDRFGKYRIINFETAQAISGLTLPHGTEIETQEARKLSLRFDRTQISASQVAAAVMNQIEVVDFSLTEPDLSTIVKQLYNGVLKEDVELAGS